MSYFFDTYAIIEIINQSLNYLRFKEQNIITSALNISEVYYILMDRFGESFADNVVNNLNVTILEFNKTIAIRASKFRYKNKKLKLSYADCIGYCLSKENGLIFLTGDDGFKNLNNVEFVK